MTQNPYSPPSSDALESAAAARSATNGKAYSAKQVAGATFLGSPLAGAVLLASNFRLFGLPEKARSALIGGIVITLASFVLAFLLPEGVSGSPLVGAYTFGSLHIAKQTQGGLFSEHLAVGGLTHSGWRAVGIGLAGFVALFTILVGIVLVLPEAWLPA